jgi:predicted secreted protein
MKKIYLCTLLLLMITTNVWAFGQSTIMEESLSDGKRQGSFPIVDGVQDINLQKNINTLLKESAKKLGEAAGGQTTISYEVTLNRPSMFSVILKASGDKTLYKGVNVDITAGKECDTKDFFYVKDDFNKLVGDKSYVFAEDGLLLSSGEGAAYSEQIPYKTLLKYLNIASCARFMTGYKVTAETEGKTLPLKVGTVVSLYLPSNPSTGFEWYMANADKTAGVVGIGNSFFLPINANPNATGVPGNTIIFFSFDKPGTYKLDFEYKRPWVQQAGKTMTYNFIVQ